ncbi:MAG: helix-turn-helix transcriptional regulator [Candidatus Enterosoma sp.]|nr:helix-turn-helix domain-containing protein [Bacilli bacterium]MDD6846917.1 helix-turn-helix transcriptional regulator [bacterium]MDY2571976.1 helix-turn-helix transcriptional regulator [Candidatus Enterosoma sp.]MCI6608891.1 helix-turn-helix domain-containing protein [Bacilli bacterium]MCI7065986.1 helix-turn-helix domain-containing protein [Bacilli bacterium]
MKLKDNLKFLRRKAGLTQAELAKKMHLKQYNISDYEIGRIEPNIAKLVHFADIFNVSLDTLVGRKPKEIEKSPDDINSDIRNFDYNYSEDDSLAEIAEMIKDLSPEEKRQVVNAVGFLVNNYAKKAVK